MGRQAGDKALPGHTRESAPSSQKLHSLADRISAGPMVLALGGTTTSPAKRMHGILHNRHRRESHQARLGLFIGLQVVAEFVAQAGLPEAMCRTSRCPRSTRPPAGALHQLSVVAMTSRVGK